MEGRSCEQWNPAPYAKGLTANLADERLQYRLWKLHETEPGPAPEPQSGSAATFRGESLRGNPYFQRRSIDIPFEDKEKRMSCSAVGKRNSLSLPHHIMFRYSMWLTDGPWFLPQGKGEPQSPVSTGTATLVWYLSLRSTLLKRLNSLISHNASRVSQRKSTPGERKQVRE